MALAHTVAVKLGSPREFHSLTKIFFIKCQEEDYVAFGKHFFALRGKTENLRMGDVQSTDHILQRDRKEKEETR